MLKSYNNFLLRYIISQRFHLGCAELVVRILVLALAVRRTEYKSVYYIDGKCMCTHVYCEAVVFCHDNLYVKLWSDHNVRKHNFLIQCLAG